MNTVNFERTSKEHRTFPKTRKIVLFGALSCLLTGAFTGIPAVVMGHRELSNYRKNPSAYPETDKRVVLGGIILGYIGIIITIYFLILGSIAVIAYFGLWDGLREFIKTNFITWVCTSLKHPLYMVV